jgi:hypothetical protein
VARLEVIFDEDLQALSEWLDVDLSCKNFTKKTAGDHLQWSA